MNGGEPKSVVSFLEGRDKLSETKRAKIEPIRRRLGFVEEQLGLLAKEEEKLKERLTNVSFAKANLQSSQGILKEAIEQTNPDNPRLVNAMRITQELERD